MLKPREEAAVVLTVLVMIAALSAWAFTLETVEAQQVPMVKALPAQGYTPQSIVIERSNPNEMLVCAEPVEATATYACRTVGEFRKWVRERPSQMKR